MNPSSKVDKVKVLNEEKECATFLNHLERCLVGSWIFRVSSDIFSGERNEQTMGVTRFFRA